jgi:hypothetical protein
MMAGEKTFWNAPPLQLGLNKPSGEGGAKAVQGRLAGRGTVDVKVFPQCPDMTRLFAFHVCDRCACRKR